MTEAWKPIAGFEGIYSISDLGRVRSELRFVRAGASSIRPVRERIRKLHLHSAGYMMVTLQHADKHTRHYVHHLVAVAFIGPRPAGLQVCHNDGDPANCAVLNLRYDTRKANEADKKKHGRFDYQRGRPSRLSAEAVQAIRLDSRRHKAIAKDWGLDRSYVSSIKRGASCAHM